MNKTIRTLMLSLIVLMMTVGTAMAGSTGTTLDAPPTLINPVSIDLCTKVIPSVIGGWGICDNVLNEQLAHGSFSYETTGASLTFSAEASNLGMGANPYPEVSGLSVVGTTISTITWRWTTPNKTYFTGNEISVKNNSDNTVVSGYPKPITPARNTTVNHMVVGLAPSTSYTITVKSTYTDAPSVDESYSLIYYRDTDENHVLPSTEAPIVIDQRMSSGGIVVFGGITDIGSVPASPDVNTPNGKIWIVPTDEIKEDGFLKWTGYGVGNTMTDYLFESDVTVDPYVQGGIDYNKT